MLDAAVTPTDPPARDRDACAALPPVFVINLDRSPQRLAEMRRRLGALGIPFTRFPALDGRGLDLEALPAYDGRRRRLLYGHDMTPGEMGCLLSHRGVYEHMVAQGIELAIVLEDDVHVAADFCAVVAFLSSLPLRWDLIRFLDSQKIERKSRCLLEFGRYRLSRPATAAGGAHGYLLTREAARRLLLATRRNAVPIDTVHGAAWRTGLEVLAVTRTLVVRDEIMPSTIGDSRFDKTVRLDSWARAVYPATRLWCKLSEAFGKRLVSSARWLADARSRRALAVLPAPAALLPRGSGGAAAPAAPRADASASWSASGKTLTMCLTTARSGTALLASLLALADDVDAQHEAAPDFHEVLPAVREHPEAAVAFVRERKLPRILHCQQPHYVETSHLFGEGFFEAFIALAIPFRLIVLNRDPRCVAESNWRVDAVPGRSKDGLGFLLSPGQSGVMRLPGWEKMSDYQLCYWYALEMERRKTRYAAECARRGWVVAETRLDDLKDWARFRAFCATLGFVVRDVQEAKHARICATRVNPKRKHGRKFSLVPLARQERAVWRALGSQADELRAALVARYGAAAIPGPA